MSPILKLTKCGFKFFNPLNVATRSTITCASTKVAVVLSGCGVYDGSEIHEAASVLSHLTRHDAIPHCFAPKIKQYHVIDHVSGKEDQTHCRNVLVESARISRGKIYPLSELVKNISCFEGVVFPGGFGVAKNLSDFAIKGSECTLMPEVETIIKEFHKFKKPIAMCCIAPILAARVLCGVRITLGLDECDKWPYRDAIKKAEEMGAVLEHRNWNEVSYDEVNLVITTPAFMYDGYYHQIDDSIGKMINFFLTIIRKGDKF